MKRIIFVLIVLAVLLSACNTRPSDADCLLARQQMTGTDWEHLDAMEVNLILNNNFAPAPILRLCRAIFTIRHYCCLRVL